MLNLFRGEACQVTRELTVLLFRKLDVCWLRSASYSHLLRSPAFVFSQSPAM